MRAMLCRLLVFTLAFAAVPAVPVRAATPAPHIAIDSVPEYGAGSHIAGHVWFSGAAGSYSDYAVTLYLEIEPGGTRWGPKPTFADPVVPLDADGRFDLRFVTGGTDENARVLYALLVPAGHIPDGRYDRSAAVALSEAVIHRAESGVRIEADPVADAVAVGERVDGAAAKTNANPATGGRKQPAGTPLLSLCYGPYTGGLSPDNDDAVPLEVMTGMLDRIAPYTDSIRLFGVSGELGKLYPVAKRDYGLRVVGGCWFDARYTDEQVRTELDALVELANSGLVDVAVVGSELLYRGDCSADKLVEYLGYVRERIGDRSIPVTTSDTAQALLDNREVLDACDVVMFTAYPYYDGVPIDRSLEALQNRYAQIRGAAGGKTVMVGETGHPTRPNSVFYGEAQAGMNNARQYVEAVYDWSREQNVEVFFFEAADEDYKAANGAAEGHFGFWRANGELKNAYARLLARIAKERAGSA